MMFNQWLADRYAPSTAKAYKRVIDQFIDVMGESGARAAMYVDLANWIGRVREQTPHPASVRSHLYALRAYYAWQIECGLRADNPSRALVLADKAQRETHLPNLLTPQEIRTLRDACAELPARERVMIGLLAWSALTGRELVNLAVHDVDLAQKRLNVAASNRTNARLILLPKQQVEALEYYLENERPRLERRQMSHLILTRRHNPESVDGVQRVVQNVRWLVPSRRLTPTLIRQSVLAMMLNAGQDLRSVQLFAGHRHPGTTERYRFTGLEELRAAVTKLHPMD